MGYKLVIVCDHCNSQIKMRHIKCIMETDTCPYCGCKMSEYNDDKKYGPHCL